MSEAVLHVLRARLNGGIRKRAHAANSGAACRSASCGVRRRRARCAFTRTRPSSLPSATSLCGLPRPVRPGASGCGSARKGSNSRCNCTRVAASDGVEASYTAIHHVLTNPVYAGAYAYGKTRQETILDAAACAESACDVCRGPSGKCSSQSTTRASPIDRAMRRTRNGLPRTRGPNRTRRVAP